MANRVAKIKLTNQLAKNHLTALEKNHLALTTILSFSRPWRQRTKYDMPRLFSDFFYLAELQARDMVLDEMLSKNKCYTIWGIKMILRCDLMKIHVHEIYISADISSIIVININERNLFSSLATVRVHMRKTVLRSISQPNEE